MRLVRRLTALLLLVVGVVFTAETYLSIRQHLEIFGADLRRDHRVLGRALALAVERAWQQGGDDAAIDLVRGVDDREGNVRIRLVFLDRAQNDPYGPGVPIPAPETFAQSGLATRVRNDRTDQRFYTFVPLSVPGHPLAALEISESIASDKAYLSGQIRSRLVTAAVLFGTCALVAWVVGAYVVGRPIQRLVAKARRIAAGDFSGPLAIRRRDEISQLAGEIDSMAAALDSATRDLAAQSTARIAALEQLHHADRLATVGKLASGLAHELGTPLNVVSGRARMIADAELESAGEVAAAARTIVDQAERMTRIVRQLLDFARRKKSEKRETDLVALCGQVVAMLEPLAAQAGVSLHASQGGDPVRAAVETQAFQQAVTNLVMNAIHAASSGGRVSVGVHYEARQPRDSGRQAVVEIADDGDGIPERDLPMIFDPFFTTKPVGEGTGLGLAVAHGIVEEHGGRIEVRSECGRGSVFRIRLDAEAA